MTVAIRLYEAHGLLCEGQARGLLPRGRAALIYSKRLGASGCKRLLDSCIARKIEEPYHVHQQSESTQIDSGI